LPSVDIYETDSDFLIKAEMPGVSKDDLDISINGEYLEITGRVDNSWENGYKIIDREFILGDYYRRFYVGNKIDRDNVKASIENGVLNLTLGKSENIKPRKIEIASE
jgi:HSP20 family protein